MPRKALWLTEVEFCGVMVTLFVISKVDGGELVHVHLHISRKYCRSSVKTYLGFLHANLYPQFKISQLLLKVRPKIKLLQITSMKLCRAYVGQTDLGYV